MKTAMITGASGCIGSSIVDKYYKEGFNVVLVDNDQAKLDDLVAKQDYDQKRILKLACDVSDENAVKRAIKEAIEHFQKIDVLVNTAGICGHYDKLADMSYENFKKIYTVNVFGTFLMMKNVIPYMKEAKSGSIINFGSVSGMRGYNFESAYGSSKWAVIGMTKCAASEYGECGIRINSVSPGWVKSPMMDQTLDNYGDLGKADINLGAMHRVAKPSEIADAVYFLGSDDAAYITGTNLPVEGGMLLS